MASELRAAPPGDVGGAAARLRLLARIAAVQRTVGAAGDPTTPRARSAFKRASRQLRLFAQTVDRGRRRAAIAAGLAQRLSDLAGAADSRLVALLQSP